MFEKISGFFKRFTRSRKRQSGETTIMNGKEPGLDDFGLDEGFGELGDLEESIDAVGTAPVGAETGPEVETPFSDADFQTGEADFSTGGTDFEERTISDEISGAEMGLEEAEAEVPGGFPAEAEVPAFDEVFPEPEPVTPAKRILTLVIVAVITIILGGVFQLFVWPTVGKLVGFSGSDQPKLDIQAQLNAEQRKNARLKSDVDELKGMGNPAEVKVLQQQLIQARDSQGPMNEFEESHNLAKQRQAAYKDLVKRIGEVESEISKARADISKVRSQIEEARLRVVALAERTEEEYEHFRLELVRAELSQRLLIELRMEDVESFRAELAELEEYLSQLRPATLTAVPPETASASEASETDTSGS